MAQKIDVSASTAASPKVSASTSTAASPNTNYDFQYDVFTNHSGSDVQNFVSHLHQRLFDHGFRVFLERSEMQEGENLTGQIKEAIATASVHIAIFSPGYAQSKWRLDELLLMLKSKATVIPVFYHVKPSDLRINTDEGEHGVLGHILRFLGFMGNDGVYKEALRRFEKKRKCDPQTVADWKDALLKVSQLGGLLLEAYDGDEGELVDRIVRRAEEEVTKPQFFVAKYPIGLDEKLQDFEKKVVLQQQQPSGETKIVGIVGSGGVGKTTLAMEFFNRKRSAYHRSCILSVKEAADRSSLHSLQNKLVKDLTSLNPEIRSIGDGIMKLSHYLCLSRPVIILFDDVEQVEMDALYSPLKHVLHSGSLILVTSRNKDVLIHSGLRESSIYEMSGLNEEHSQELFCLHAFHKRLPVVGYKELVTEFLKVCNGMPLSLKVLGALVYQKDLKYWEAPLGRALVYQKDLKYWEAPLGKISPDIQSILQISYDDLDDQEKEMFLDIACFFIKEDRDMVTMIWDASGWEGWLNLQNLVNKCLVEIDSKNCIRMHDHLRDFGRGLAEKHRVHCRLLRPTDNRFLKKKELLPSSVRGINMVEERFGKSLHNPVKLSECSVDMSNLQLLRAEGDCLESISNLLEDSDLLWLCWNSHPSGTSLPSWIPLKNLRFLQVSGGELETLWPSESQAPVKLRELNIGAALVRCPKSIGQLEHLEKIEMIDTIKPLPEEFFNLHSLKHLRLRTRMASLTESFGNLINLQHLDLSGCTNLESLPYSFGNLSDVQHICLKDCKMLRMLPHSFGNLIRLKHLSLAGCENLTISIYTLGNISTLECLDFSHCLRMEALPLQVTQQRSLEELNLSHTNFKELPFAIGNLSNLKILKLQCPLLEMLPLSLGNLTSLQELTLHFCNSLKCLPDSIGELKQLRKLLIHYATIERLPVGVTQLENLEILIVRYCPLSEVPFASAEKVGDKDTSTDKGLPLLKHLDLHGTRIKELSFPQGVSPNLQHLNISFCDELVNVGALPTTLMTLNLEETSALEKITGLPGLAKLRLLDISRCKEIKELPGLETLTSLEEFRGACKKLKRKVRNLAQATIEMNRKKMNKTVEFGTSHN